MEKIWKEAFSPGQGKLHDWLAGYGGAPFLLMLEVVAVHG